MTTTTSQPPKLNVSNDMFGKTPSFTRFKDLPYDIRFFIWAELLPTSPQIVHIFEREIVADEKGIPQFVIDSDARRPTELFACHEAYKLLKDWGPESRTQRHIQQPFHRPSFIHGIYFTYPACQRCTGTPNLEFRAYESTGYYQKDGGRLTIEQHQDSGI